jgi:general secretion pathway protein E
MINTLATILVEHFGVKSAEVDRALQFQRQYGGRLESVVSNLGILSDELIMQAVAQASGLDFLPEDRLAEVVEGHKGSAFRQERFLQDRNWFKLREGNESESTLYLTCEPNDIEARDYLDYKCENYHLLVCSEASWRNAVQAMEADTHLKLATLDFSDMEVERLRELASEAPVVNLVNTLITKALNAGASDLHIEPSGSVAKVRIRVDGVLRDLDFIPASMSLAVVSRIKIMASLDIAEKRRPQDGKIALRISGFDLDIRVSVLPLHQGESIVMRFLLKESVRYELETLGIADDIRARIQDDLERTSGVILVTGPTGSGKTTSLYSFLNLLNNDKVKVITLEDPVEYQLEGINQIQVKPDIGFDFAAGLRSILRQDPDILMLGEIRDAESAKIAMQSALTGHLVFSTVHTNTAASAYTRLIDLGVEEFLLNAALVSIMAQRLVRKVCPECSEPLSNDKELIEKYKLQDYAQQFGFPEVTLRVGRGCSACAFSGYQGRVAIIEYLRIDDHVRALPKDAHFLQAAASHMRAADARSLYEDGLHKAMRGVTTLSEVVRVAG